MTILLIHQGKNQDKQDGDVTQYEFTAETAMNLFGVWGLLNILKLWKRIATYFGDYTEDNNLIFRRVQLGLRVLCISVNSWNVRNLSPLYRTYHSIGLFNLL